MKRYSEREQPKDKRSTTMEWTGRTIRLLREKLDMDHREFARVFGYTHQDVRAMERPDYRPTKSVADALNRLRERALREGL